jgi:porin
LVGLRNMLATKGINLDVDLLQSLQGLNSGGLTQDSVQYKYGDHVDYRLNVDFGKLGLWPGGFLQIKAESQFGELLRSPVGSISAVNAAGLLPVPFASQSALSTVLFTQFLAPSFGGFLGKLDVLGGDANAFAHDQKTQFMNLALTFNLVPLRTVPYSPLGAGFVVLPTKDVLFTLTVLDTEGNPERAGFDTVFKGGTTLTAETRVTVKPFGVPGHQLIGGSWSDKLFKANQQDPRLLLTFLNLPGGVPPRTVSGSWSAYYNFDQFVYTIPGKPDEGFGIFGRIGLADPKTNAIEQFYSFGLGGQGVLEGRDRDRFGLGYYYLRRRSDLPGILLSSYEQAMEIFYNVAATNWLYVTPDV